MSRSRRNLAATIALIAVLVPALATTASAAEPETHCVIRVIGQKPSGEFITTNPQCFATFDQAIAASGVRSTVRLKVGSPSAVVRSFNRYRTTLDFTIGTHYEYPGLSGSSITVTGANCAGGYINLGTAWIDRISSTSNGCYRVRHWSSNNASGSFEDTIGGGNLTSLDNSANSIQYLAS